MKAQYPIIITHKGAVNMRTVELVSALLPAGQGVGFENIAKVMREMVCLHFLNIEKLYYLVMEAIQLRRAHEQEQAQPEAQAGAQALLQSARASSNHGGRPDRSSAKSNARADAQVLGAKGQPAPRGGGTINSFFQKKVASKPLTAEAACPAVNATARTLP